MKFTLKNQTTSVVGINYTIKESNISAVEIGNSKLKKDLENVDFESAMEMAGYGLYHWLLLGAAMVCAMSPPFDTTTMSFVIPAAKCDLNLTILETGALNGITYCGMVLSGFLWGYLGDTFGRKKLIVSGFVLGSIFDYIAMSAFSTWVIILAKFFNGFAISGPYAILTSYLSEMHSLHYRGPIMLLNGIASATAQIILPLIAWSIIPEEIEIVLIKDVLVLRSWNIFLGVCATLPMIGAVLLSFFPESPKFLMSQGQNDKAMKTFQLIYSLNSGNPPSDFPVKSLKNEMISSEVSPIVMVATSRSDFCSPPKNESMLNRKISIRTKAKDGWTQLKPIFQKPFVNVVMLLLGIQLFGMSGINTIRLWLPQLFTAIAYYENSRGGLEFSSFCGIIEQTITNQKAISSSTQNLTEFTSECIKLPIQDSAYINSIIIGSITMTFYLCSTVLIQVIGKKRLMVSFFVLSGLLSFLLVFSTNMIAILITAAFYMSLTSVAVNTLITVSVDVVPTSLRTMCVSMLMMSGRIGALGGNIFFPSLLKFDCKTPFFIITALTLISGFLSMFLPKTDKKPLM